MIAKPHIWKIGECHERTIEISAGLRVFTTAEPLISQAQNVIPSDRVFF